MPKNKNSACKHMAVRKACKIESTSSMLLQVALFAHTCTYWTPSLAIPSSRLVLFSMAEVLSTL